MKNHLDNYLPSMSLAGLAASRVGIPTGSQWLGTVPRNYEGFRKCLLKISELSLEQWALIFFTPGFLWESDQSCGGVHRKVDVCTKCCTWSQEV